MTPESSDKPTVRPPRADLEREFVEEYVRARGYDPSELPDLPERERQTLLKEASLHASAKLAETSVTFDFLNILCPVDFSDRARTAVAVAAGLAEHFKARLGIVTAVSGRERRSITIRRLEEFVTPVVARFSTRGPAPDFVVRPGDPGETILSVADECLADVIVMSMHGTGADSTPYGSTARHVMQQSPIPLLVIPPALHAMPNPDLERMLDRGSIVLAPVGFHPRARYDVRIAAGLAESMGLGLLLLHVVTPRSPHDAADAATMLRELSADIGAHVVAETMIASGDAAEEIIRVAFVRNAGAIVMGLRGDDGTRGVRPGIVAYDVMRRAGALVLALPEGRGWIAERRRERARRSALDAPLRV